MTTQNQVYKCGICGGMLEVLIAGGENLTCCGEKMRLLAENTTDASKEKHVPIVEKTDKGVLVKIGSVPHPMEEKHYIQFIEIIYNGVSHKKFLKPGDKPEAEFCLAGASVDSVIAREHCNLHGLWKN